MSSDPPSPNTYYVVYTVELKFNHPPRWKLETLFESLLFESLLPDVDINVYDAALDGLDCRALT